MSPTANARGVRFGGMRTPGGYVFELTGGRLCLDLANTKDERSSEHPRELLGTYRDALDFATQAGVLSRTEARRLSEQALGHPADAARALRRLIDARETIFAILEAVAQSRPVLPARLQSLNALIADAGARRHLARAHGRFEWGWLPNARRDLGLPLWASAWSAAELLASADLNRLRRCEGSGCAWLFMDTSRNGSRRWCDMSVCGNRAKARRHRSRATRTLSAQARNSG
jgi:predicted RNA-binding Zn ribbon-like protein